MGRTILMHVDVAALPVHCDRVILNRELLLLMVIGVVIMPMITILMAVTVIGVRLIMGMGFRFVGVAVRIGGRLSRARRGGSNSKR